MRIKEWLFSLLDVIRKCQDILIIPASQYVKELPPRNSLRREVCGRSPSGMSMK